MAQTATTFIVTGRAGIGKTTVCRDVATEMKT